MIDEAISVLRCQLGAANLVGDTARAADLAEAISILEQPPWRDPNPVRAAIRAYEALADDERKTFLQCLSLQTKRSMEWLAEALNSGDGVYRP